MAQKTDFIYSTESEPHRIRTKKILKQFPGLRDLIGKNPNTIFAITGLVLFQVVGAYLLTRSVLVADFCGSLFIGCFRRPRAFCNDSRMYASAVV